MRFWKQYKSLILTGTCVIALASTVGLSVSAKADSRHSRAFRYEVKLTNLTRGQVFSPAVLYTHGRRMARLFTLGEPASDELAAVAEDAMSDLLFARLEASPHLGEAVLLTGEEGPILPGETASTVVQGSARASLVSLAGMLVTTNDAFYALESGATSVIGSRSFTLVAYDAGSEANNELCSHIPGPPCGSGGVRATEGAEGYVHVHSGIHGHGDLDPSEHDWNNPVALVTIKRLRP